MLEGWVICVVIGVGNCFAARQTETTIFLRELNTEIFAHVTLVARVCLSKQLADRKSVV